MGLKETNAELREMLSTLEKIKMDHIGNSLENKARELYSYHTSEADKYKKILSILLKDKIDKQSPQYKAAVKIHRKTFR